MRLFTTENIYVEGTPTECFEYVVEDETSDIYEIHPLQVEILKQNRHPQRGDSMQLSSKYCDLLLEHTITRSELRELEQQYRSVLDQYSSLTDQRIKAINSNIQINKELTILRQEKIDLIGQLSSLNAQVVDIEKLRTSLEESVQQVWSQRNKYAGLAKERLEEINKLKVQISNLEDMIEVKF